jgi:hypothetical protein
MNYSIKWVLYSMEQTWISKAGIDLYGDDVFAQSRDKAIAPMSVHKDAVQQLVEQEVVGNVLDDMWYVKRKVGRG